jgi:hypothetical protein
MGPGAFTLRASSVRTKTQSRRLREIGRRIMRAIDPGDHRLDDQPLPAAMPAQAP